MRLVAEHPRDDDAGPAVDVAQVFQVLKRRLAPQGAGDASGWAGGAATRNAGELVDRFSSMPTLRTYLVDRLGPGGADHKVLAARLHQEQEVSIRRAIVLSLGVFAPAGHGLDRDPRPEMASRWRCFGLAGRRVRRD